MHQTATTPNSSSAENSQREEVKPMPSDQLELSLLVADHAATHPCESNPAYSSSQYVQVDAK
jgi:hypothetical protein